MEELWRAPVWLYPCLLVGSGLLLARRSRLPPTFVAFQRKFSQAFILALVIDGLQNVYTEALYKSSGFGRKRIALLLVAGHAAAIVLGTVVGVSADFIGRKQICRAYAIFTTIESFLKLFNAFFLGRIFHGIAASVLPCVFEAWMISEHEKHGFRADWIAETFLSLNYAGAIASLGSTAAAGLFVPRFGFKFGASISAAAAVSLFFFVSRSWLENFGDEIQDKSSKPLLSSFRDRKVVILGIVQGFFDLSVAVFWLLWIPTIVADGREIHAGSIYTCLIASVMLGTGIFGIFLSFPLFKLETVLVFALVIASICLFVPAYDYQEIPTLVAAFCIFQICVGLATPLLAYIRATCISSSRRAGIYSIYQIPTHLVLILFLTQGPIRQAWDNSTVLGICGFGNLAAAIGMLLLKNSWKKI